VNDPRGVWRAGVRLVGVIMGGADLRLTDLRWAKLVRPDLKNADLCQTGLADADVRHTQLRGGAPEDATLASILPTASELHRLV
jgi:uncharacterized protein YjbI with pentapeptide repeats